MDAGARGCRRRRWRARRRGSRRRPAAFPRRAGLLPGRPGRPAIPARMPKIVPSDSGHVGVEGAVQRIETHRQVPGRAGAGPHDRRRQLLGRDDRHHAGCLESRQQEVVRPHVEPPHPVAVRVDGADLPQLARERRPGDLTPEPRPRVGERLENGDQGRGERRRRRPRAARRCSARVGWMPLRADRHSRARTAWPPNWLRSAASMRSANESSSRERNRVKSAAVIVQAGTDWSIASCTVQRPSPESST